MLGFPTTVRDEECVGEMKIRDRIKELRRVKASELLRNPRNWRTHPAAQARALRALLSEIGYADALIARELPDGRLQLIDGHLRAETTPSEEVPVLVLDVTEEEAEKLLLTLDPLAAMAEADAGRLQALLTTVRSDDEAVQELLRRTAGERLWRILHPQEVDEVAVASERADELKAKWGTEHGQLWKIGEHRVICGDCSDDAVIGQLWSNGNAPRLRMVWTDAPYGVDYAAKTAWMQRHGAQTERRSIHNDDLAPAQIAHLFSAALANAAARAMPGAAIYASVPAGPLLPVFIAAMEQGGFSYRHCLVWVKQSFVLGRSDYHYRHEPILYGWREDGPHYFIDDRTQDSVFEINRPMVSELHPTQKPLELIARMVANSSRPGELIYDPFCGSGSTLLAAHQLGRIGYGAEIDPGYAAVTLERFSMLGLKPELVQDHVEHAAQL
jgi:DNA modification methylase